MFYRYSVTVVVDVEVEADSEDEAERLVQRELPSDSAVLSMSLDDTYEKD